MAHLTEGAIISEIRGSIGSRTFSKNAYGPYVKNKLVQTNPDTTKQQNRRAIFTAAVARWQSYSQADRDFWHNQAKDFFVTNSLGKKFKTTGYNLFIGAYCTRRLFTISNQQLISPTGIIPSVSRLYIQDFTSFNALRAEFYPTANTLAAVASVTAWREASINSLNPSWLKFHMTLYPLAPYFVNLDSWFTSIQGESYPTNRITNAWVSFRWVHYPTGISFGHRTFKFNPSIIGDIL